MLKSLATLIKIQKAQLDEKAQTTSDLARSEAAEDR